MAGVRLLSVQQEKDDCHFIFQEIPPYFRFTVSKLDLSRASLSWMSHTHGFLCIQFWINQQFHFDSLPFCSLLIKHSGK